MAMFRGQINVIELIKPITLIIQSVPIGQENFSPSPLPDIPEWGSELKSRSLCHRAPLMWIIAAIAQFLHVPVRSHVSLPHNKGYAAQLWGSQGNQRRFWNIRNI